jgi:hypothetical protein
VLELLENWEGAVSVMGLAAVVLSTQGSFRWVASILAIGVLTVLVGLGAAMATSGVYS